MSRLLLVDGHNLLFQMYYGMPARIVNKSGKAIHGTLGFTGALLRMIRMTEPTHVAVLFDGEHENERAALDSEYKANRALDERDTPFEQLPDVYSVLDYLGIAHTEISVGETDDAIASYAVKYRQELEIFIASQDSDYYQLIGENVRVLRYRGESSQLCDVHFVQEKFGVPPSLYVQWKALVGDKSDNIRGIPGIGPKTAASLLGQFGSLDALLERPDRIAKPSIRASIEANAERLRLNLRLITLDGSAPLPLRLDAVLYHQSSITTGEALSAVGLRP